MCNCSQVQHTHCWSMTIASCLGPSSLHILLGSLLEKTLQDICFPCLEPVFSPVHRGWEMGEEGLLSWHSAFPHHGSNLLSPPRQSALLTYSTHSSHPPHASYPCAFMQADPSPCLLSPRALLNGNFPKTEYRRTTK